MDRIMAAVTVTTRIANANVTSKLDSAKRFAIRNTHVPIRPVLK